MTSEEWAGVKAQDLSQAKCGRQEHKRFTWSKKSVKGYDYVSEDIRFQLLE